MGITLSNLSALDTLRKLRFDGSNVQKMDSIPLLLPSPTSGKRWTTGDFLPSVWAWDPPSKSNPLHIIVPAQGGRRNVRMSNVVVHEQFCNMPAQSIIWLNERSSMVCPELLFLQMACSFTLPRLVMLGYELCGHFSRSPSAPLEGPVITDVPAATTTERLADYLGMLRHVPGIGKARKALNYIADHALSAPEAVLGTIYSLPPLEGGYGMGPVTLNERVPTSDEAQEEPKANDVQARYPDLSFPFAPVGINYDGDEHLDLDAVVHAAQKVLLVTEDLRESAQNELLEILQDVRAKVVDDNVRNRQLASRGRVVFPVTKEDLYNTTALDQLTRQILNCAYAVFGTDVSAYERALDNTKAVRERDDLLASLTPGGAWGASHGSA